MKRNNQGKTTNSENRFFNLLDNLSELAGWLIIVISLSTLFATISTLIYLFIKGNIGLIIASIVFGIGFISSILYACYIGRTKGTIQLISNSSWINKGKNQ